MNSFVISRAASALPLLAALLCAACATGGAPDEGEPAPLVVEEAPVEEPLEAPMEVEAAAGEAVESAQADAPDGADGPDEPEVPLAIAESEPAGPAQPVGVLGEVVVQAQRHEL